MERLDFLIVGSGFGGSIAAMRLAQKNYQVSVLEMGKRLGSADFPRSNWHVRKMLWAPLLRCFGLQKISFFKGLFVLHGVGVGGGSLVYANTLMRPHDDVFSDQAWPTGVDWKSELSAGYDSASRMLGVVKNQHLESADHTLLGLGSALHADDTFHATDVAVHFGEPNKVISDPYFSGDGPARSGCDLCGGCMIGCHNGSKNTLDKNYLYFAERWGAKIFPELTVQKIIPDADGYHVEAIKSTSWLRRKRVVFKTKRLVLAAGVLGTIELLIRNRDQYKTLPRLSPLLGERVRTNGESLVGVTSLKKEANFSRGIAIGSSIHAKNGARIEAVRYPSGSGAMRLLAVPLAGSGSRVMRLLRLWSVRDWAKKTIILLIMSPSDSQMRLTLKRTLLSGFRKSLSSHSTSQVAPGLAPLAQTSADEVARTVQGIPQGALSEVVFGATATAHILGGAHMGQSARDGVVDTNHEVFEYPNLYVCDGSVVPCNLAVNPSLTISALAERFASKFPSIGKSREVHFT